jgi:transposase
LLTLADGLDGMALEVAAKIAGVWPCTVYRWLRRYAGDGIDVPTERHCDQLSAAQAIEIAR